MLENGGLPLARFPKTIPNPRRSLLSECARFASPSFASSFVQGNSSMLGIELMALGRTDFTAERVAVAMEAVFKEVSWVRALNNTRRGDELEWHSFADRCRASGLWSLIPALPLDKDENPSGIRGWDHGPRDRIRLLASSVHDAGRSGFPKSAFRHPSLLMIEAGLRLQLQAIAKSWKSVVAGLRAWGSFCNAAFPLGPHFPACDASVMTFATLFRNPGTFSQYIGHVAKGEALLRVGHRVTQGLMSQLRRSTRAFHTSRPMPRLRRRQVTELVRRAVHEGSFEEARLYVVAYDFMFRVADELLPLQSQGKRGIADGSTDWHSEVEIRQGTASVNLRTRKNAQQGAVVRRHCVCTSRRRLLCGTCALTAQVDFSRGEGRGHRTRLFGPSLATALGNLKRRCLDLGFPSCGWHAFRRGGAEDRIADGEELGHVLHAGGWRSAAFLRYISKENLDTQLAFEAVIGLSDEE